MYITTLFYKIHHTKYTFHLRFMKKIRLLKDFMDVALSNIMHMSLKRNVSNTITKTQCTSVFEMVGFCTVIYFTPWHKAWKMKHIISLFIFTKTDTNLKPNNVKLHMKKIKIIKQLKIPLTWIWFKMFRVRSFKEQILKWVTLQKHVCICLLQ